MSVCISYKRHQTLWGCFPLFNKISIYRIFFDRKFGIFTNTVFFKIFVLIKKNKGNVYKQ